MKTFVERWRPPVAGLVVAIAAGAICSWLRTPLPWMIGPLFSVALFRLAGFHLTPFPGMRYGGQWVIGSALGLYFTPTVVHQVALFAPWMIVGAVYALASGVICGWVLSKLAAVDARTGFFASVPGGATEMSILAERFGGRADLVAVAQSLRIVMVVSVIPLLYAYMRVHGADPYVQGARDFSWSGLALLMTLTALGGAALHRFRYPNGWVIGSLFVSLPLTAFEVNLSSVPSWLSNAGQLMIGCSLAARFKPDFLSRAPRFLAAVLVTVLIGMTLAAGMGLGLAWALPAHVATMILAMAPGGIAEMSITAKVLQLGVPLVTAFHVARMVLLVSVTGVLYQWANEWHATRRGRMREQRKRMEDREARDEQEENESER